MCGPFPRTPRKLGPVEVKVLREGILEDALLPLNDSRFQVSGFRIS